MNDPSMKSIQNKSSQAVKLNWVSTKKKESRVQIFENKNQLNKITNINKEPLQSKRKKKRRKIAQLDPLRMPIKINKSSDFTERSQILVSH